jgi:hypothetical protein
MVKNAQHPQALPYHIEELWVWDMVINATFNNISVISWRSVLLVEETGVPGETTDLLHFTDIGSYKSNYHTIMTTNHIMLNLENIATDRNHGQYS